MARIKPTPAKRTRLSANVKSSKIKPRKPSIMSLNPDCLLKIFEYLHLADISVLAKLNPTLKDLAIYFFRLKYKHFNSSSLTENGKISLKHFSKVIRGFKNHIVSLNLSSQDFLLSKRLYSDLLLQASGENIKSLTLNMFNLRRKTGTTFSSLFERLDSLELNDCSFGSFDWSLFQDLKYLKLNSVICTWKNLYTDFNQLEDAHFDYIYDSDDRSMMNFIRSTSTLKRLSITNCSYTTLIFSTIKRLQCLEELEFQWNHRTYWEEKFHKNVENLKFLKRLKVLRLHCESHSVHRLLQGFIDNGISIEHLELAYGQMDDQTVQSISMMNDIKSLKLNLMNGLTETHILQMTNGLKLLEGLCIQTNSRISELTIKTIVQRSEHLSSIKLHSPHFILNTDTYKTMIGIVKRRMNEIYLHITICSEDQQLMVPNEFLQVKENAKWVTVNELNRENGHFFNYYELLFK